MASGVGRGGGVMLPKLFFLTAVEDPVVRRWFARQWRPEDIAAVHDVSATLGGVLGSSRTHLVVELDPLAAVTVEMITACDEMQGVLFERRCYCFHVNLLASKIHALREQALYGPYGEQCILCVGTPTTVATTSSRVLHNRVVCASKLEPGQLWEVDHGSRRLVIHSCR